MRSRRGGRARLKLDGVERAHDDIAGPSGFRARFKARRNAVASAGLRTRPNFEPYRPRPNIRR